MWPEVPGSSRLFKVLFISRLDNQGSTLHSRKWGILYRSRDEPRTNILIAGTELGFKMLLCPQAFLFSVLRMEQSSILPLLIVFLSEVSPGSLGKPWTYTFLFQSRLAATTVLALSFWVFLLFDNTGNMVLILSRKTTSLCMSVFISTTLISWSPSCFQSKCKSCWCGGTCR